MKFEEIFNERGLYVADGFAKGFAFLIDDSRTLKTVTYKDKDDINPVIENAICYVGLFTKEYKIVFTRKELFI